MICFVTFKTDVTHKLPYDDKNNKNNLHLNPNAQIKKKKKISRKTLRKLAVLNTMPDKKKAYYLN